MFTLESGILTTSKIFFVNSSDFAKDALFWLQHVGMFDCEKTYEVIREHWYEDSFLLVLMDEGEMEFEYRDVIFTAGKGDIVLLDCRDSHRYTAKGNIKFRYFHFFGASSQPYFDLIYENFGSHLVKAQQHILNNSFSSIMRLVQSNIINEHKVSVYIHLMLSELVSSTKRLSDDSNASILTAIEYMQKRLTERIVVEDIASHLNLSKFHFSRQFKELTGVSPHQYLLNLRIAYAKQLLITSHTTLDELTVKCGFDTTSNFIRAFKKKTGMTPIKFRDTQF